MPPRKAKTAAASAAAAPADGENEFADTPVAAPAAASAAAAASSEGSGKPAKAAAPAKAAKAAKGAGGGGADPLAALSETVLKYMRSQNRPFNAQMVGDALAARDKTLRRPDVQRAIDALVEAGKVKQKEYSKQKIYCVSQDLFEAPTPELLQQIEQQTDAVAQELQRVRAETEPLLQRVRALSSQMSDAQMKARIEALESELAGSRTRLTAFQSGGVKPIAPAEKQRIEAAFVKMLDTWRSRRRMATNAMEMLQEGTGKSRKALVEDLGLETDESVGVSTDAIVKLGDSVAASLKKNARAAAPPAPAKKALAPAPRTEGGATSSSVSPAKRVAVAAAAAGSESP